jgi:hypothetical protein
MNIYLISQNKNTDYDTYDSAVVIAEDKFNARRIHPRGDVSFFIDKWLVTCGKPEFHKYATDTWVDVKDIDEVKVELVGKADKKYQKQCVICSSFNAR